MLHGRQFGHVIFRAVWFWTLFAAAWPALGVAAARPFQFPADALDFANELSSVYELDPVSGRLIEHPRVPRPEYRLHCFVIARTARQFFDHARFDPNEPTAPPVMGILTYPKINVFFIGDTNGLEVQPQPFIDNLIHWMGECHLD